MENIFIELLPPWVETGIQPAFYDKESGTVLQQTARMYAKVNQLTEAYNTFTTNLLNRQDEFEDDINETVDDYIEQFNTLHDYVHDYFDNLDVQHEVNVKIDAMVENGTMDTIINQEVFGQINTDISNLNSKLGTLANLETPVKTSVVNAINSVIHRKYVLVGDSYLGGYNGSTTVNSWGYYFKQYNNISDDDCYIWYESGAGFVREGSAHNYNFKKLIEAKTATISNANEITDFVIAGGVNDNSYDMTNITNKMSECLSYVKSNYPNARIYVGCIGNKSTAGTAGTRNAMAVRVLNVYKKCIEYGARYLTNIEMIAHDWSNYGSDDTHMSETGYQKIGAGLMSAMDGAYSYYNGDVHTATIDAGGSITDSSKSLEIVEYYMGYTKQFVIKEFNFNDFTAFSQSGTDIQITDDGELDNCNYLRRVFERVPAVECELELTFTDSQYNGYYAGSFMISSNGALFFHTNSTVNGKSISGVRLRYPVTFELNALVC